jgi:hypothetical protein
VVAVAKTLGELNREGRGPRDQSKALKDGGGWLGIALAGSQDTIGKLIGHPAGRKPHNDGFGEASKVFHQRDAQGDRDRPEFADGEWLYTLIRLDKARQLFDVEGTVGVGDNGPSYSEDAGVTLERTFGELRQSAIEARRQVLLDFADLFIDDVEIVEQPFRRRRDRLLRLCCPDDFAIGFLENGGIFVEPRSQQAPRPS